ncbi:MAG: NAD(P)-binding protein [Candidatus Omnitrophica bacterium]|nr:NAD(P)-binding protein [Candidatus Omnitrophota bacterium]
MTTPKPEVPRETPAASAAQPCVRVAGAGPAGLAAAIRLRLLGRDVEVHESSDRVGSRWCGGFQVLENFSEEEDILEFLKRSGVPVGFRNRPVHRVRLWDPKGIPTDFESPVSLGYCVTRGSEPGDLDHSLWEAAKALGVNVRFGSHLPASEADIYAGGPRRVDGIGREIIFDAPLEDRMSVLLDPRLSPGGYAYFFVFDGRATLGMAIVRDFKNTNRHFEEVQRRFADLEKVEIPRAQATNHHVNFFVQHGADSGPFFAGEAGGFQDYLFGFGMRFALESGILAAQSVASGGSYANRRDRMLLPKQRICLFNRFAYEKAENWIPGYFVREAVRSGDLRKYLRSWYEPRGIKIMAARMMERFWRRGNFRKNVRSLCESPHTSN